jgi:low affinity Fe/Cu permease
MRPAKNHSRFGRFSRKVARVAGQPVAFAVAVLLIIGWLGTGPIFGFSNTWQLVVNTGTTIVTFLMVFLIQNTQNRDGEAVQIKLDELLRVTAGAHNALLDLEELEEKQLDEIRAKYIGLARGARDRLRGGEADTDVREIDATEIATAPSSRSSSHAAGVPRGLRRSPRGGVRQEEE